MMVRQTGVLILLLIAAAAAEGASSIRCDGRLAKVGDPIWQVDRACPEPFWEESFDRARKHDRFGHPVHLDRYQIWTLNFGQRRLMRRLVFVNGYLRRIDALGYGVDFRPGSRSCSARELAMAGETAAEVFARCGSPDHRFELPAEPVFGYRSGPFGGFDSREIWTYEFGPTQHARELLFRNGRLQRIRQPRR